MRNQIRTVLLLGVLSALLVAVGGALGTGTLWVALGLAAAVNLGAYFFSDRLVLRMHGAEELPPEKAPGLHRMVEDLAMRAGIPKPRVCLVPDAQPNAFATGRSPDHAVVAVTSGLLRLMNERQVRGVVAHEIAHIKNRDILVASIASVLAAAIGYVAQLVTFSMFFGRSEDDEGGSAGGGLLAALVAPLAATLVQLGVSRSREYLADESAARFGGDPEGLASALEKLGSIARLVPAEGQPATASLFIVNPLSGAGRMTSLFSTHPPIEERVLRLRRLANPSFARFAA